MLALLALLSGTVSQTPPTGTKPPADASQDTGESDGQPVSLGTMDKAEIDATIKRNMNQIRYCYQRELTKHPDLQGKVVIKFVIAPDGTVRSAEIKSSTMGSPEVEDCLTGRFMRFVFPEPRGGGIVIVSYPFIFEPAEESDQDRRRRERRERRRKR